LSNSPPEARSIAQLAYVVYKNWEPVDCDRG
jgi:hypothetical protein